MQRLQLFTIISTLIATGFLTTSTANAQTWKPSKLQQQGAIPKKAYFRHPQFGELPVQGNLRFINILHQGPVNNQSVKKSFLSAVKWYDSQNVTARPGGDHNFFKISGLNNSRCVILGWCFYYNWGGQPKFEYNYLAVNMITGETVSYFKSNGSYGTAVKDPNHFQTYYIGTRKMASTRIRIQLWKHGKDAFNAAAAFWKD